MSANIRAAASTTKWYGTDFNTAQAGFAQQLAARFRNGPQLADQSSTRTSWPRAALA